MPTAAPKKRKEKKVLVNFKVPKSELALIRENAKRYAKGNVSRWIRRMAVRKP